VVTLTPALNNGRYQVHVCCLHHEGAQADGLRAKGIDVVCLNMRLRYWPVAVYRLYRLIRRRKVQIVHTHLYEPGILGPLVGRLAGVPVMVTTEHGMTLWKKRHHLLLQRWANGFTDKMIAVSEEIRQQRINREGVPADKIVTIPNAVDTTRFGWPGPRERVRAELQIGASSILIGTVGRLVPAKRYDCLLDAARIVCQAVPEARFLFVGDGPLRNELESRASQLALLPEQVRFLGSRQDVPDLLSALDVFVLSSEREGLPVSLLEAMAAARPVVATRVGGIPDVIQDGHNGLLVSPHDPAGMAAAVLSLARDGNLSRALAEQARQTAQSRFSVPAVSRRIIALYDALVETKLHIARAGS